MREADLDAKDRNKEQEELEELKNKIFSGEYDNPTQEFERLKRKHDDMYKPKILIDVNMEATQQREREMERERERELERQRVKEKERLLKERYVQDQANRELAAVNAEPIESDSSEGGAGAAAIDRGSSEVPSDHYTSPGRHSRNDRSSAIRRGDSESRDSHTNHNFHDEDSRSSMISNNAVSPTNSQSNASIPDRLSSTPPPISAPVISLNLGAANAKKKKLEVKDVFNNDDENEENSGPKKRKLVPLGMRRQPIIFMNANCKLFNSFLTDYDENQQHQQQQQQPHQQKPPSSHHQSKSSKRKDKHDDRKEDSMTRSQEEKRRHIKSIIDKIPTEKNDLFNYKLDWNEIDNTLMDKKIRPWINKKIIEYIGEPEPTLVDFICSKVLAGSTPQGILDDVQMVS